MSIDKRVRETIPLDSLKVEGEDESVYSMLCYDGHPDFITVEEEESNFDQEKSSCWISLVLQRISDGKYFSWGYQRSPWWNSQSLSPDELVEVFPVTKTITTYE